MELVKALIQCNNIAKNIILHVGRTNEILSVGIAGWTNMCNLDVFELD